jgi:hypothetical protein
MIGKRCQTIAWAKQRIKECSVAFFLSLLADPLTGHLDLLAAGATG